MLALAQACGNGADPRLIDAIAQVESGRNTEAVGVNRNGSRDHGLLQFNDGGTMQRYGLTEATARLPCNAIDAASRKLIAASGTPSAVEPATIDALIAAISSYNTGSKTAGVANGYVGKVFAKLTGSALIVPPAQPAHPSVTPAPEHRTLANQIVSFGRSK